jgi:thioredoxin reductase
MLTPWEGQAVELLERQIERLEHDPEIRAKLQQRTSVPGVYAVGDVVKG